MHVWNKDTKTAIKTKGQKEIFALLFLYMEIRSNENMLLVSIKDNPQLRCRARRAGGGMRKKLKGETANLQFVCILVVHTIAEEGEIAHTRVAGEYPVKGVCYPLGVCEREHWLVRKAEEMSHTAYVGVKRNNQVGGRHPFPHTEVNRRVLTHHPAQEHVEFLLRRTVGHLKKRA